MKLAFRFDATYINLIALSCVAPNFSLNLILPFEMLVSLLNKLLLSHDIIKSSSICFHFQKQLYLLLLI
jgi:hypothetical protein